MQWLNSVKDDLLHLVFPHVCEGCGTNALPATNLLCLHCMASLPQTNFHMHGNNPVEKTFWGRLAVAQATAQYYFTKESLIQQLMHQLKYRGNKELGLYLGMLMAHTLQTTNRFCTVQALVPLPLHARKERQRGYNQSALLCQGMAQVLQIPVIDNAVCRTTLNQSQTRKNRVERWNNAKDQFVVSQPAAIANKHILLVDDVVTTGATLEACGRQLLQVPGVTLSISTLCFSAGN